MTICSLVMRFLFFFAVVRVDRSKRLMRKMVISNSMLQKLKTVNE